MRFFLSLFLAFCLTLAAEELTLLPEAQEEALRWVQILDKGEYQRAWEEGSVILKAALPSKYWVELMVVIRASFGKVMKREAVAILPSVNPPHLPKGNYVAIFYQTQFSEEKEVIELVTLVQQEKGNWKPVTYMAGKK